LLPWKKSGRQQCYADPYLLSIGKKDFLLEIFSAEAAVLI